MLQRANPRTFPSVERDYDGGRRSIRRGWSSNRKNCSPHVQGDSFTRGWKGEEAEVADGRAKMEAERDRLGLADPARVRDRPE